MTQVTARCDRGADTVCATMYYLVNPPVGTYNMHLSFSNGGKIMAGGHDPLRHRPGQPSGELRPRQ